MSAGEFLLDFVGFWMSNGAIFLAGVLIGWMDMKDMEAVEAMMVRCMQGHVAEHSLDCRASEFE